MLFDDSFGARTRRSILFCPDGTRLEGVRLVTYASHLRIHDGKRDFLGRRVVPVMLGGEAMVPLVYTMV